MIFIIPFYYAMCFRMFACLFYVVIYFCNFCLFVCKFVNYEYSENGFGDNQSDVHLIVGDRIAVKNVISSTKCETPIYLTK